MTEWDDIVRARLLAEGESFNDCREAADELATHLADVYRSAIAAGADPATAHHTAESELDELGPLGAAMKRRRGGARISTRRHWQGWDADIRAGAGGLLRRPGFSAAVFVTLALGIAINTTAFSFVNAILLRDVPYRDPSRLAFMWTKLAWIGVPRAWVAGPHVVTLLNEATTIEDIAVIRTNTDHLTSGGTPELVRSGITSANLFDVLGVHAELGRTFVRADEPQNVTIISYALWQRRFGGRPSIVGQHIEVSGQQMEVIGVLPESFHFQVHSSLGDPLSTDLWFPTDWNLAKRSDSSFGFAALVRVTPTATLAAAQAELDVIGAALDRTRYKSKGFGWQLIGVRDDLVRQSRTTLWLVATGAAFLLVVICANIAGLVLVRVGERRREFAVRTALGAGRWQIARLIVSECVLLAAAAGVAGAGLAWMLVRLLVATNAVPLPRLTEVNVDWRVVLFTTLLSLIAGVASGLAPALASRSNHDDLKDASRGSSGQTPWMRGVLVAGELAVAALLIAGSLLLVRSYAAIRRVDAGFNGTGVLTARHTLDQSRYPNSAAAIDIQRRFLDRLASLPGITAVGATSTPPLTGDTDQASVTLTHSDSTGDDTHILVDIIRSTPGYMRAMGITLLAGRDFTAADRADGQGVAIVDERFARTALPTGDIIGRKLSLDAGPPVTIVGVVRQARQYHVERDDREQVYRPATQDVVGSLFVALRSSGDPLALIAPLRSAIADVDPKQPLADVRPIADVVNDALSTRRLQLEGLVTFAAGAAFLAAFGVYGILASIVAARSREIGIRIALGASHARVRSLILRDVLLLAGVGTAIGLIAALAGSRVIGHLLFSISAHDPASYFAAAVTVIAAAAIAAYVPARRAARVDPADALRADA